MNTPKTTKEFMRELWAIAHKLGVEDIEPGEMAYALEAYQSRGESPEQVAKFLGWGEEQTAR